MGVLDYQVFYVQKTFPMIIKKNLVLDYRDCVIVLVKKAPIIELLGMLYKSKYC